MKKSSLVILLLSLALVLTLSFAVAKNASAEKSKDKIYSSLNKSFYELTEHIEKIDLSLKKAALSKDSHALLSIGSEIRESSAFALSDLSEMESDSPLTNINIFLNQSGDYVKAVALSHSDGSSLTKEEQDNFLMLSRFSEVLKNELHSLRGKIATGEITYSVALSKADETLGEHLSKIEKEHFSSFEALSYNGAFSAHTGNISSSYLPPFPEITKEEALSAAFKYLYNNIPFVFSGETGGKIPSYMFYCDTGTSHYAMEVTKNGGKLLYYSENRPFNDPVVGQDEAIFHALSFAKDAGYDSLSPIFYENSGSTLTVTLAPFINDVIYYTDLIKVEVALDNADIIGFNAEDYLMNHKARTFPEIFSDINGTLSGINPDFFLKTVKKCYIPSSYGKDIACIEAMGYFDNKAFLIYINAETGIQEEILLLNESEGSYFAT